MMPVAIAKAMGRHGAMHMWEHCVRKQVALHKDTYTAVLVVDNEVETVVCSTHKLRMASSRHLTLSAEEMNSSLQRLHLYHEDHRESIDLGALRFSFAKRTSHLCHVSPRHRHVVHVPAPLPPLSLPSLPPFVSWLGLHARTCPTHVGTRFEALDRPNLPSGCASPSKTRRHVALQLVSTKTNNCCTNTSMGNQTKERWTGTHERLMTTTTLECLKVPNTWRSLPSEVEAVHDDLAMHWLTKYKGSKVACESVAGLRFVCIGGRNEFTPYVCTRSRKDNGWCMHCKTMHVSNPSSMLQVGAHANWDLALFENPSQTNSSYVAKSLLTLHGGPCGRLCAKSSILIRK